MLAVHPGAHRVPARFGSRLHKRFIAVGCTFLCISAEVRGCIILRSCVVCAFYMHSGGAANSLGALPSCRLLLAGQLTFRRLRWL